MVLGEASALYCCNVGLGVPSQSPGGGLSRASLRVMLRAHCRSSVLKYVRRCVASSLLIPLWWFLCSCSLLLLLTPGVVGLCLRGALEARGQPATPREGGGGI